MSATTTPSQRIHKLSYKSYIISTASASGTCAMKCQLKIFLFLHSRIIQPGNPQEM